MQDGTIFCWRFNSEANSSAIFASLKGHGGAVLSLTLGANRLYSGSMDSTIRVCSCNRDLSTLNYLMLSFYIVCVVLNLSYRCTSSFDSCMYRI